MPWLNRSDLSDRAGSGDQLALNCSMTKSRRFFCLTLLISLSWTLFFATSRVEAAGELPRFASLRADKVNVRAGPGVRYPIAWVYLRQGLPVEIVAEFELWRKIRDRQGTEGWAHKSLLSGNRSAIVKGGIQTLFRRPGGTVPVLRAEPGVQGRLLTCEAKYCRLRIAGTDGWLRRKNVWGVYPHEVFE